MTNANTMSINDIYAEMGYMPILDSMIKHATAEHGSDYAKSIINGLSIFCTCCAEYTQIISANNVKVVDILRIVKINNNWDEFSASIEDAEKHNTNPAAIIKECVLDTISNPEHREEIARKVLYTQDLMNIIKTLDELDNICRYGL